jgi:hypothetical protein
MSKIQQKIAADLARSTLNDLKAYEAQVAIFKREMVVAEKKYNRAREVWSKNVSLRNAAEVKHIRACNALVKETLR